MKNEGRRLGTAERREGFGVQRAACRKSADECSAPSSDGLGCRCALFENPSDEETGLGALLVPAPREDSVGGVGSWVMGCGRCGMARCVRDQTGRHRGPCMQLAVLLLLHCHALLHHTGCSLSSRCEGCSILSRNNFPAARPRESSHVERQGLLQGILRGGPWRNARAQGCFDHRRYGPRCPPPTHTSTSNMQAQTYPRSQRKTITTGRETR